MLLSRECTLLFYGFYSDSSVNSYSIPVAYFVMIVVLFLASLIFICTKCVGRLCSPPPPLPLFFIPPSPKRRIANEYANNASYIFDSAEYPFSTHVLGLWDYTLTENESVREMQRGHARQLRLKLQAMVREEIKAGRMAEADEELSIGCLARDDALPVVVSRILVSVFYFGIVGGAAYFVVYLENALSNKTYEGGCCVDCAVPLEKGANLIFFSPPPTPRLLLVDVGAADGDGQQCAAAGACDANHQARVLGRAGHGAVGGADPLGRAARRHCRHLCGPHL